MKNNVFSDTSFLRGSFTYVSASVCFRHDARAYFSGVGICASATIAPSAPTKSLTGGAWSKRSGGVSASSLSTLCTMRFVGCERYVFVLMPYVHVYAGEYVRNLTHLHLGHGDSAHVLL